MANDLVINGKIVIDESGASGAVKSIKQQLKEANAELINVSSQFGETSTQAAAAAKKVAELKDRIGDAKALTEAFSPDKKFQAFSQALSGVAGGFAAVQGAQALFGTESKALEETLVKVNAAMALSQGLSAVTESIDAFKNLGTVLKEIPIIQNVITAAQWLWNAAMEANPIGAIVVAITALIAGVIALTKYFMDNAEAAKAQALEINNAKKAIEAQKNALKENAEALDRNQKFQLDYAKASGKSAEEIRKLELALINKKIAEKEAASQTALATVELEKNRLATLRSAGADDEQIKAQEENIKAARGNLKIANDDVMSAGKERIDIINRQTIEIKQQETNAIKESENKRKEASEKTKQQREQELKDLIAAEKDAQKQLQAAKDANYLQAIKDDQERAEEKLRIEYENQKKSIEQSKASEQTKNALLAELGKKYWMDLAAIEEDAAKKKKEQTDKESDEMMADLLANLDKAIEAEEKASEEKKKIAELEADHKKAMQQSVFDALEGGIGILKQVAGQNKALQKAAIIAESAIGIAKIVLNTNAANAAAILKYAAIPGGQALSASEILMNKVNAGIGIASSIAATAKALQGIGASGGVSGSNVASGSPSTSAPIPPQLATTTMNQSQINQLSSATTRAFVLESDVTSNQERIIRLNRAARIN